MCTFIKLGRWRGHTCIVSRSKIASLCGGKVAIVFLAEIRWAHSPFFIKLFRQVRAALIAQILLSECWMRPAEARDLVDYIIFIVSASCCLSNCYSISLNIE